MSRREVDRFDQVEDVPVEVPSGFKRPESLTEMIARAVRTEVSAAAERQGFESFEEAMDFDLPDDDFISPHEERAMEVERLKADRELIHDEAARRKERAEARKRFFKSRKEPVPTSGAGGGKDKESGGERLREGVEGSKDSATDSE